MSAQTRTTSHQSARKSKQSASTRGRTRAKRGNASITINKHPKTRAAVSLRLRWRWPESLKDDSRYGRGRIWGNIIFDVDDLPLCEQWKAKFDNWGVQLAWDSYLAEEDRQLGTAETALPRPGAAAGAHSLPDPPAADSGIVIKRTVRHLITAYLKAGGKYGDASKAHVEKELRKAGRHIFNVSVTVELEDGTTWLIPKLGDLPLDELTRDVVLAWIEVLAKTPAYQGTSRETGETLGGKTMKDLHSLLSGSITWALINKPDWISKNPAYALRPPKTPKLPKVIVLQDQLRLILRTIDPRYVDLVMVLVNTGMRWSEATALEVQDVKLLPNAGMDIHVRQAWKDQESGPQKKGTPKTSRGNRHIVLEPGDAAIPAMRRAMEGKKGKAEVFTSPLGFQLRNGEFHETVWQPMRAKLEAGWNGRFPRIHDLRHTFASIMIHGGTSIADVSKLLGHERVSFTYDTYVDIMPGGQEQGMRCVNVWLQEVLAESVPYRTTRTDELSEDDAA